MEWTLLKRFRQLPGGLAVDAATLEVLAHDSVPRDVADALEGGFRALVMDNGSRNCYCLEHYGPAWLLWGIGAVDVSSLHFQEDEEAVESGDLSADWTQMDVRALLPQWVFQGEISKAGGCELDMVPPGSAPVGRKPTSHADPISYLTAKYNEALFSPELPLAYFAKTTLPRFDNLCKRQSPQHDALMGQGLRPLVLGPADFDARHSDTRLLTSESQDLTFLKARKHCLAKYNVHVQEDGEVTPGGRDLALVLKAREIKLQILLLLQLIELDKLDKNFKDFQERYGNKLKRRSLNVGRRLRRSRSTLPSQEPNTQPDCCELLDLYLDKLSILEMLLDIPVSSSTTTTKSSNPLQECKKGLLDKSKESSATGFTRYILIPYCSKKMPRTVKFIMHKIKGPSMKPGGVSGKKRALGVVPASPQASDPAFIVGSGSDSGSNSPTPSARSSRSLSVASVPYSYSRPHLSRNPSLTSQTTQVLTAELLDLRTSSNLSEFLEAETKSALHKVPSALSRTSSDLVMNHLQRRQLSVSDLATGPSSGAGTSALAQRAKTFAPDDSANTSLASHKSFRRVGKRKTPVPATTSTAQRVLSPPQPDKVEVLATPMGKRAGPSPTQPLNMDRIVESPGQPASLASPAPAPQRKKVRRRLFGP